MKLIEAKHAPEALVNDFLTNNDHIDQQSLLTEGYVAIKDSEIVGCFVLKAVEDNLYWLKQLYITKSEAATLPGLVEAILILAKEKYAKEVYVHSHQPMIDILLEALQFHPNKSDDLIDKLPVRKGTWWSYEVS